MNAFEQNFNALSNKIRSLKENILTEEATKSAFVMPFIQGLGYDVFNPLEVIPEFVADISNKKGEKVDYCILAQGEPIIIIECKHWQENLQLHSTQLERYFAFTKARFGILTNGIQYLFFTDLDDANKMDTKPFFEINLENPKDTSFIGLKKFHKKDFDASEIFDTASEMRYIREVREIFERELQEPSVDFTRHFAGKVHNGLLTKKVVGQFQGLVKRAINQIINETISDRLHKAIVQENEQQNEQSVVETDLSKLIAFQDEEKGIITTEEEIKGYEIVREILAETIEPERIFYRDTKSYFGVLLDDNNRKPICRLRLETNKKYLIVLDAEKTESRIPIQKVEHIYMYAQSIIETAKSYLEAS